jgi:hypothetical protein
MTLPFFGSGIVELPPEGFKRAKNSRKMQMVFFVHEGKVLVTVGPPAVEQNDRGVSGGEAETNEFAISKGGVWVVPRGMFFALLSISPLSNHFPLHCVSATRLEKRSSPKATTRHHRGLWTQGTSPVAISRGRAVSNICQLIFKLEELEERPRSEAVCATSRRNNLSIAPKHRTSCVTVAPQAPCPLSEPKKDSFGWGVTSQMPACVLSSVARHWTALGVARPAAVQLCAQEILAGPFSCGASLFLFLSRPLLVIFSFETNC